MPADGNRSLLTALGDGAEVPETATTSTFACGLRGDLGAATDEAGGVMCSASVCELASGASALFAELEKENHPRLLLFLLIVGDAGGDSALHCALGNARFGLAAGNTVRPALSLRPPAYLRLLCFRLCSSSITILAGLKSANPRSAIPLDCGDGEIGFLGGGVRV